MKVALLHYPEDVDLLSDTCDGVIGFDVLDGMISGEDTLVSKLEAQEYLGICMGWRGTESIDLIDAIRSSARLMDFPIIGVFENGWSRDVDNAFSAGIDDFSVSGSVTELRSRLIALGNIGGYSPESSKQKVYVFDTDRRRRALFARFLRRMGLDIVFAEQSEELFGNRDISLVVASAPSVTDELAAKIAEANHAKWLMTGSAKQIIELPPSILLEDHVSFFNIDNDIAQIVFVANELLVGTDVSQKRASARLQHGTPITYTSIDSFIGKNNTVSTQEHLTVDSGGALADGVANGLEKEAGNYQSRRVFGYTYNLSKGGVFIRSFAPPPTGTNLEIEFQAPTGRGRVIVLGTVVWRQNQLGTGAATPRGFGFQYHDQGQAAPDMSALETGYNALHARFRRSSDVI